MKKYVYFFTGIFCCFVLYSGCNDHSGIKQQEMAGANWCKVFTQSDLEQAILDSRETDYSQGTDSSENLYTGQMGQIVIMEDDGSFYGSVESCRLLINRFYRYYPDNFDFISIYTNFNIEGMDDAFAWHLDVQNQVEGIGMGIFDYTEEFGSAGRLQGIQLMNNINMYPDDPYSDANMSNNAFEILAHEMAHQWGGFVAYKNTIDDFTRNDLAHNSHWTECVDTDADLLGGHDWSDNGDGSFTCMGTAQHFWTLTLYTMGLAHYTEVSPFFIINPAGANDCFCFEDTPVTGTAEYITMQQIIDAEGYRVPDYYDSRKDFNMVFILVIPAGNNTPSNDEFQWLEKVRQGFPSYFQEATHGRGTVNTNLSTIPPPQNLRITKIRYDSAFLAGVKIIELAWDKYDNELLRGYNIYRTSYKDYSFRIGKVNRQPVTENYFIDGNLDAQWTHSYAVTAVLTTGEESPYSNIASE